MQESCFLYLSWYKLFYVGPEGIAKLIYKVHGSPEEDTKAKNSKRHAW